MTIRPKTDDRASWTPDGRLVIVGLAMVVLVIVYLRWADELSLERLVERQNLFRSALQLHPVAVFFAAFVFYVLVTSTLLGSAAAISVLFGWLFGMLPGLLLVSFASTTGATITFLASRYFFRSVVQRRFAAQVQRTDAAFRANGISYLLALRLIPGIPFFLLNALMGLTPIRWQTYWWVSQLGMLPATILFVYAGSTVPDLATLQERGLSSILNIRSITALVLIGLLPIAVSFLRRSKWIRRIYFGRTVSPKE